MTTTTVPLSTVFTAPASCSSSWTYEAQTYNSITSGILLQNAIDGFLDTDCFPPGFANAGRGSASQIFSPGACPFGYVTQLNSINGVSTTATCCSSDFSFTQNNGLSGCLSTYKGATSLIARSGGFGSADTTSHTSISGTFEMWGIPIIVAAQSSQFSLYTTSTSSTASSTSSTQSTSTIPSATSTSTGTTTPSSNRLTTGAKVGIAVGVVVGVILLLSMALLFWRHRRRSLARQDSPGPASHAPGGPLYHDGYGSPYQSDPVELGQHMHRAEVKPAAELSSPQHLVELGT